jgi:hypothetical protein
VRENFTLLFFVNHLFPESNPRPFRKISGFEFGWRRPGLRGPSWLRPFRGGGGRGDGDGDHCEGGRGGVGLRGGGGFRGERSGRIFVQKYPGLNNPTGF